MIVVMTDAVGRGGKRYKLERQGADTFAMRDESGSTKAKRYTANHVAMLTVICLMKRTFSMDDIHSLLRVSAATHGIDHAYNFFCEAVEESLRQLFCGEIAHTSLGSCDIRKPDGPAFALQVSNAADLSPERRLALSAATSVANKIYVEKCFELGILDGARNAQPRKAEN